MSEKVLVTGGLGFVGSHIVDLLIDNGYDVIVIDNLKTGKKDNAHAAASYYEIDIRDKEALKQMFDKENICYIIHQAAQSNVPTSIKAPAEDAQINIIGTINLLELAKQYGVKKFVYASSAAIYGEPVDLPITEAHPIQPKSFYGVSKYAPEEYIRLYHELYGLSYTIFRYANIYGPRQDPHGEGGVISIFIDRLLRNQTLQIFGDGGQTRDFVYVKDIARANLMALQQEQSEIVHLSSNTQTSLNQLIETFSDILGKEITPEYKAEREGDIYHSYMSNQKVEQYMGWKPEYELKQGLTETVRYFEEHQRAEE